MTESDAQLRMVWRPIADLGAHDLSEASQELPPLAEIWQEERQDLADEQAIAAFNEKLAREWAVETGILEHLYTLDRGVTQLLIERGIDSSLIPHEATDQTPEHVAALIADQRSAVDELFDLVTDRRPLGLSFIKSLHALMTRHQQSTTGLDQFGRVTEVPLERGQFKRLPNNPTREDGQTVGYCPPEQVDSEMERLIDMHHEHMARGIPPDVEAAWLHHRFTQIHPFQDGNGRIARALASLVFLQRDWFPLVLTRDDRVRYIDALEAADDGNLSPLVSLFAAKQKRAFVSALGIAREVGHEGQQLDQQLAAITEMFGRRDRELRTEYERARQLASEVFDRAVQRLQELASQLNESLASGTAHRHAFVDLARSDDDERKSWNRWQIVEAAKQLDYFAGLRGFVCWARLGIETEGGRGEILLSMHEIGREYRGVVGVSLCFYRRRESEDGERHAVDLEAVCEDVLQINYKENPEAVAQRFDRWLDRGLVVALEAWRRGE